MEERDFDGVVMHEIKLLREAKHPVQRSARILDFGCGDGSVVNAFRNAGYEHTFGCDFPEELGSDERLRAIEHPYRLPYDDDTFDCVVSNQVFEHVQDYRQAVLEIRRVLSDAGVALHLYPGRWRVREPHTFVPVATVLQCHGWLSMWAALGVRNEFQQHKPAAEVARLNYKYLRDHTTYYTRRETLRQIRTVFPRARFLEREQLAVSRRAQQTPALARYLGPLAAAWSEMTTRALLLPT